MTTKAPSSLHDPTPASMLVTLARYRAKQAVLEQYRAQGRKPWWDCEAKDITKAANVYLQEQRMTVSKQQSLCRTPVQNGRPE